MVIVPIVREILRQAVRAGGYYYRAEGKAFNKLYRGFPQSSVIGRGVRHGLTAGSVIGSAFDTPGNAPFQTTIKTPPRKPYKARSGQPGRSRGRNFSKYNPRRRCRCPSNRYRRASRYR